MLVLAQLLVQLLVQIAILLLLQRIFNSFSPPNITNHQPPIRAYTLHRPAPHLARGKLSFGDSCVPIRFSISSLCRIENGRERKKKTQTEKTLSELPTGLLNIPEEISLHICFTSALPT